MRSCLLGLASKRAFAQARKDASAENDRLQEKLDDATADLYLLRQENAHLKKQQETHAEVLASFAF